jgi:peptide methionine sulfoxide reductase msrA/msrB
MSEEAAMSIRAKILIMAVGFLLAGAGWWGVQTLFSRESPPALPALTQGEFPMSQTAQKSREEWKKTLPDETYKVMIACGTEPPWSGKYNDFWETGDYYCAACGALLFHSSAKYDHGTGWPSFFETAAPGALRYLEDRSAGMIRTEVRCAACDGHLGHVFDDGPPPSGRHYCINSAALEFRKASPEAAKVRSETAIFAAGCFWGVEEKFGRLPGVLETEVGYTGGRTDDPTYEQVCSGDTGHAEAVRVVFDPSRISYPDLVRAFFSFHDPTQKNRQGPDVGTQYRSSIFTLSEEQRKQAEAVKAEVDLSGRFRRDVATEIVPAGPFTRAEEYHQKYNQKNGRSCIY